MHLRALLVQPRLGALALCLLLGDAGPMLGGFGSPRALSSLFTVLGSYLLAPPLKLTLLGVSPPAR